ncbi:hypothetical protein CEH05_16165 [Halobacillus halophilus]|uniref:Uncharacterized protein n=2 Tax=Halobacillus halophilus TaxID=1570 RepID=I0JR35_HALH3|nr:hypothetical protein [Halobacillus halophilus]ASF40605.1 hypothetical protein CEH05_16165 [Halobacillus halophilus]CCG46605.1 hypothetical protein HBHAL_4263 [Halobacillus halophilus DSM 2266]
MMISEWSIQYSNTSIWKKKARGSMINMLTQISILFMILFLNGSAEEFLVYLTGGVAVISTWQMIYYLKMPERDYIRFEDQAIDIRRGIADPRWRAADKDVKRVQQVGDVLTIRKESGEEEEIYLENVTDHDADIIIKEFQERYGNRMHTVPEKNEGSF